MQSLTCLRKRLEIIDPFLTRHGFILEDFEDGKDSSGDYIIRTYKKGVKSFYLPNSFDFCFARPATFRATSAMDLLSYLDHLIKQRFVLIDFCFTAIHAIFIFGQNILYHFFHIADILN